MFQTLLFFGVQPDLSVHFNMQPMRVAGFVSGGTLEDEFCVSYDCSVFEELAGKSAVQITINFA